MTSTLESHLGYWLRFVSNHVSHAFSLKLEAHDVTVAEWVVMRDLLDRPDTAPSGVAERIGMTRGAITKLVDRLAARKLVERKPGRDDRRYQTLALTATGRALVPKLAVLADRNDRDFFGHLSPAERHALERTLKALVRHHGLKTIPTE
jgi:DNA-binding MarR family transcriptional regulator